MAKPFKFRYVNQLAGAFTAVVVIALVVGFVFAAHAQKWFQHVTTITFIMPADGFNGVKEGADVHMLGTIVGTVDKIDLPKDQPTVHAHIKEDFARFIRSGSQGIIIKPIALADPYINIEIGTGEIVHAKSFTLTATPEVGASDALNQTLLDVRDKTLPAVNALLQQYTQLAINLQDPRGSLQGTLANLDHLTAQLGRTDNVVGQLLNDKHMQQNVDQIVTRLSRSTDDIQAVIANLRATTNTMPELMQNAVGEEKQIGEMMAEAQKSLRDLQLSIQDVPQIVGSLQKTVDQLPDIMAQVEQTLEEVKKLVHGLEGLPFVRENITNTPATSGRPLRPSDVGGGQ